MLRRFPIWAFVQVSAISPRSLDVYLLALAIFLLAAIGVFLSMRLKRHENTSHRSQDLDARKAILGAIPSDLILFELDEKGTYLDWYAADSSELYVPPERFLGKNIREIMPPEVAERLPPVFRKVLSSGEPASIEFSLPMHGHLKFCEARILKWGNNRILSIVRDLTEKKRAQKEVRDLSTLVLKLQDEESRRMAKELHDITAQNLFAIMLNLENMSREKTHWTSEEFEAVKQCQDLCERSLHDVRTLSYLFRPPISDRIGFVPALKRYLAGVATRSGIDIRLYAGRDLGTIPSELETDLTRLIQEALYNVFRLSGRRRATVRVDKQTDHVVLKIEVTGHHRTTSEQSDDTFPFGIQLLSMRERLRRWEGQLEFQPVDEGVVLVAKVPVLTARI